ncbi:MAG: hypothetical protein Q8O86_05855 [Dehalococcoidia bacterium]|nr:hypothetical protein [Dehalococcoidia bacterium]
MKIDIHAHFYPQEYLEEISRLGAASSDPFDKGWYGQMDSASTGQPSGALTKRWGRNTYCWGATIPFLWEA